MNGVSFVVPVHNGAAHLAETIASIADQRDGRPMEIIVVEDASRDGSAALLKALARLYPLIVVAGPGRGAAAAINAGVRLASYPIVCQVDQDVVLDRGWLTSVGAAFDDPAVAAAQGHYTSDRRSSFFARVMGLDLALRYTRIGKHPDHVCTGNTAYRAAALDAVGLLDESLGYGYDNDLSYRLQEAGYRLVFCPDARSRHQWREGLRGYLAQQYGFGYGRLDVLARHPRRYAGDAVSPAGMMGHPFVAAVASCFLAAAIVLPAPYSPALAAAGAMLFAVLFLERTIAGVRAWRQFEDPAALSFPFVHLLRDLVWVAAIAVWGVRRFLRRAPRPGHSMTPRAAA